MLNPSDVISFPIEFLEKVKDHVMNSSEYKSIAEFARDAMREKMVAREQHKSLVELKLDDMRRKKRIKQELPDRVSNLEEKFEEILKLLKKK